MILRMDSTKASIRKERSRRSSGVRLASACRRAALGPCSTRETAGMSAATATRKDSRVAWLKTVSWSMTRVGLERFQRLISRDLRKRR